MGSLAAREWGESGSTDLVRRYGTLLEINDVIHSCRNIDQLLRELAGCLRKLVPFDAIGVALVDDERRKLRVALLESSFKQAVDVGFTVPIDAVPGGWVIEHQQPLRVRVSDQDPRFKLHNDVLAESGLGFSLHLPLTTALNKLGELGFVFKEEIHWTDAEIQFMQHVANQVALAIENALNFDEVRRAHSELAHRERQRRLLLELTNSISSSLEIKQLLEAVTTGVRLVVPCAMALVALPNESGTHLRVEAIDFPESKGLITAGIEFPVEMSLGGKAFREGAPIVLNERVDASNSSEMYRKVVGEDLRSQCFMPFVSRGRSLGLLVVARRDNSDFSEDDVEFLGDVGKQITIALENALNYEAAREAERTREQERDRLQLLMDLTNHLATNLDLRDLLQAVIKSVRLFTQCHMVIVHLPDNNGVMKMEAFGVDTAQPNWDLKFGTDRVREVDERRKTRPEETLVWHVFTTGKPLVQARINGERFPRDAEILRGLGVVGGCVIPLVHRGRVFGTLGLGRQDETPFTEADIDFLMKLGSQVALAIENALAFQEISTLKEKLSQEKLYLEDEIRSEHNFSEIIAETDVFKAVLKKVETVAQSDANVLILGETGTGKELIARAIHESSRRKGRTFVKLNCAAIPTGLLESELFGHERGAFTGAIAQKIGRMELANGGTLFLDEVGDIPLELQPKLLRALQEREFERLGSVKTLKADVRFLAATHRDLKSMITDGQFRSDLFYRLNVFPITIPPLRERKEDVPRLIRYFVSKHSKKMDKRIETIPTSAMSKLQAWHWPGNVRELENFIERSVILTTGTELYVPISDLEASAPTPPPPETLSDSEREHILKILRDTKGVLSGPDGAAARLGLKRTTLQSKMKKLGITRADF